MAGSPALLLLLGLGLCCPGIQGQAYKMTARFRDSSITQPRLGQQLELECVGARQDSGVFWVRQDKDGTLHFIVFISALSRTTFKGNEKTSTHFEARKYGSVYYLVVKSFMLGDEGNYFCLMNSNQMLYFSHGQPAFIPVTITTAPTVPAPTTQSGVTKKDPCLKTPDPETSKEKELNFFCNIFIWVPLSGACLLLLIALIVTTVLCQQTRRRRCRCKRPVNGKPNVKPSMPSQHT
ncbi:T-cell surface glycoprotein CD8 alpha chain [Harpia harpyja]|uniref:T-cell surface glycoprotein CD8 alpha chain n=1 Tax=Harpia harpyja TaxID=202280 RepID=UPI0022B0A3D3|nr:T-cell surface glycoprotein CD8 alpha chain [Harpia harpyja]